MANIRKIARSNFTKEVNFARRVMAEEDAEEVRKCPEKIKCKFKIFEESHFKHGETLQEDKEIEPSDKFHCEAR